MVAGVITKSRAKMRPPQVGHFAQKHIRQCVLISQLPILECYQPKRKLKIHNQIKTQIKDFI